MGDFDTTPAGPAEDENTLVLGGTAMPGPAVPNPLDDADVAEATDGSIAAKLRAVGARLQETRTKDFTIPGTEGLVPGCELVMRARAFKDKDAFQKGIKTEAFIVKSTEALFLKDSSDELDVEPKLEPIPTWGKDLADALGVAAEGAVALVRIVFNNPVALEVFGAELVAWNAGRNQDDEQSLGE